MAALAWASAPALAYSVSASYFAFTDNGSYIDGDVDSSNSRTRAVVDSGFVHTPLYMGGHPMDWTWQGKASANLNSGSLRTYAFSDTTDSHETEEAPALDHGWRAQTTAAFSDSVIFAAAAGASAGGPVAVTFRLDVKGNFAGSFGAMSSSTFLLVNTVKSQVDFSWDGRLGPKGSIDATATATGTVTALSTDPHQLHALLSVTVMAVPGSPILLTGNAFTKAAAGPFASVTSDFDHTATLSIETPAGYVFTSQSGVLLTTPVPEPTTWWSLGTGLALLAARPWRRSLLARRGRRSCRLVPLCGTKDETESAAAEQDTPARLPRPPALADTAASTRAAHAGSGRDSPRWRFASKSITAALLLLSSVDVLAQSDVDLPLSQSTFACAGKATKRIDSVIDKNDVYFEDGGTAWCFGHGSTMNKDPFVTVNASATGGDTFPMAIQVNVNTEYWYRAQEKREPPFVPNVLPEKFPLKGKVETGMTGSDSFSAFVSAYVNKEGFPQILIGNLRGNGTLNKVAQIGAGHLQIVHVEYRAQCRVVAGKGQTVTCKAQLDPVPEFDQEAFDLTNALAGRPTFKLDDYYTLEFSPNMVPEPGTWLGLVAGLPLLSLAIRHRRLPFRRRG